MKLKFVAHISLAALFTGVLISYSFTQRFIPKATRTAIPAGTSTIHTVSHLETLLKLPIAQELQATLQPHFDLKEELKKSRWTSLSASSEISLSHLNLSSADSKAWVASSWVGWRSPWLRWKLEGASDNKIAPLPKYAVWPIWELETCELEENYHLTIALTDNLLLICYSQNSNDIKYLLSSYEQELPKKKGNS